MNFNSLEFLIFLPVVLLLYWLIPNKFRWVLLLIASYYFYMSWNAWLIFLIAGTTLVSYLAAIFMEKTQKRGVKKLLLILSIIICLGILVFFKYFIFLVQSAIDFLNLFSLHLDDFSLNIILPVGISFYTFQTLSYVIDVYKGKFKAEKHLGYYALFVCYFPQLVAGPIERPADLIPQLKAEHKLNWEDFSCGFRILVVGFFYKCVVADFLSLYVNNVFNDVTNANTLSVFLAGFLFSIQMFCDFAGYADIATGAARMMGVRLTRNFNRPYMSTSYSDFFRRWHITLSRWFTDYVYIPLGGNRKGKARRIFNTFIVFLLCGLWHGDNWTYVLWGGYAAIFLSIESLLKKPVNNFLSKRGVDVNSELLTAIRIVGMQLILIPAAIIFRSNDLAHTGQLFLKLFTSWGVGEGYFNAAMGNLGINALTLLEIAIFVVCIILIWHYGECGRDAPAEILPLDKNHSRAIDGQQLVTGIYIIVIIALCWIALLSNGMGSAFQYFQF